LEQALAAVGTFFAGIEIVENRYGELTELGTPTLVADQMYHCAAVIGRSAKILRALSLIMMTKVRFLGSVM